MRQACPGTHCITNRTTRAFSASRRAGTRGMYFGMRCPFGWDNFAEVRSADCADDSDLPVIEFHRAIESNFSSTWTATRRRDGGYLRETNISSFGTDQLAFSNHACAASQLPTTATKPTT